MNILFRAWSTVHSSWCIIATIQPLCANPWAIWSLGAAGKLLIRACLLGSSQIFLVGNNGFCGLYMANADYIWPMANDSVHLNTRGNRWLYNKLVSFVVRRFIERDLNCLATVVETPGQHILSPCWSPYYIYCLELFTSLSRI